MTVDCHAEAFAVSLLSIAGVVLYRCFTWRLPVALQSWVMPMRIPMLISAIVFASLLNHGISVHGQGIAAEPEQARRVIRRGLDFLVKDAVKWREEHSCSTCHHGLMTAWVYAEAQQRGYELDSKDVNGVYDWVRERLSKIDQPRDERPGWNMVNSPAVYLSILAQSVPEQKVVSPEQLRQIAEHLVRHQEQDGSWAWSIAPAKNRPPPFFESDEVVTRLAVMALSTRLDDESGDKATIAAARQKGIEWLKTVAPTNTTQSTLLELLMRYRNAEASADWQASIEAFMKRQQQDGGWGQLDGRPSDAYATGQSLYFLRVMGIPNDRPELKRAVAFLVSTQSADGSWPMTRRGHPGVTPSDQIIPIVYYGSAWGTLGLLATEPRPAGR